MQYFTPEPFRGTKPQNKTTDKDKTLWQHLMDRPKPTITTARSAALNGLDDSLLREINDVLRTADHMATDDTTTKEVTFYPPLAPRSPPTGASIGDLIFNNPNAAGMGNSNNNNPRPSNSVKIYTPGMIPSAPDPRSPSLKFDSSPQMQRNAAPTPVAPMAMAPRASRPRHRAHANTGSATPMMPGLGMMPVTPSVPRMPPPPQRTPPPRSNLVPPQRAGMNVRSSPTPQPPPRMSIRQQHAPMRGPVGPTMGTTPRPPPATAVVSTQASNRRFDDGTKSPALMSQYLEPPPMKPKFGTQVNWNPAHFVPSIPSPLNRAQQERELSKIQIISNHRSEMIPYLSFGRYN